MPAGLPPTDDFVQPPQKWKNATDAVRVTVDIPPWLVLLVIVYFLERGRLLSAASVLRALSKGPRPGASVRSGASGVPQAAAKHEKA